MKRLAFAFAALAVSAAPAAADKVYGTSDPTPPAFGENPRESYASSQWFAFELKFGPYSPDIDSSPGLNGNHPFADLFNPQNVKGRPPGRLLTSAEFDFQFLHKFGSLGVGTSLGFYRRTTHSFTYPGGGLPQVGANGNYVDCQVPNCMRSGDETALNIIPLEGMLVYRFDVLALRYRVPLVPYFKIGLAYYIWWIENGGGAFSVSTYTPPPMNGKTQASQSGYGGTFGWVLNPGIALLLDPLDPTAAKTIDAELGINHTYIFCEMHYADISGFGASDKLVLSDLTLNAGLAFEF